MTIEEEKGITIPDEELATFSTVGDIVNYLEKQA
jgi:acyl carrier protein